MKKKSCFAAVAVAILCSVSVPSNVMSFMHRAPLPLQSNVIRRRNNSPGCPGLPRGSNRMSLKRFAKFNENEIIYSPSTWRTATESLMPKEQGGASTNTPALREALQLLATVTLSLIAGDENSASSILGGAAKKRHVISQVFEAYDICRSGTLSVEEAQNLFVDLARSMVEELAEGNAIRGGYDDDDNDEKARTETAQFKPAQAHARRVLSQDEAGNTIDRVARKLLILADGDGDGKINLQELAQLFEMVFEASVGTGSVENEITAVEDTKRKVPTGMFPQPLRALAGSLQLLPPKERSTAPEAANRSTLWNVGVPGDDHTLRRVILEDCSDSTSKKKARQSQFISLIGLGRSADVSAYFLPELGIALDAGLHVSSLQPRTVLLTHGHRDHIGALPIHASHDALLMVPDSIKQLVHNFLVSEAQLNYGDPTQMEQETLEALGGFNIMGVRDGMRVMLPKDRYSGSPTPLGIEIFAAPHKKGVPAVSYGIFRQKQRLKKEYQGMNNRELGALLRREQQAGTEVRNDEDFRISENYDEGVLFYTGDTTITLLRERWRQILPKYKYIIHEVTFLGHPSSELDNSVRNKGHTHYAQLHPWICAFPGTTFICVHWSLRYDREEVLNFFESNYGGVPNNVVLWL